MAIHLQKSWLLLHLLVFTASFGTGFVSDEVSFQDADKNASSWTLTSKVNVAAEGVSAEGDDDAHFASVPLFAKASFAAAGPAGFLLSLHRIPRYELQPRTTQGPPVLTV